MMKKLYLPNTLALTLYRRTTTTCTYMYPATREIYRVSPASAAQTTTTTGSSGRSQRSR